MQEKVGGGEVGREGGKKGEREMAMIPHMKNTKGEVFFTLHCNLCVMLSSV